MAVEKPEREREKSVNTATPEEKEALRQTRLKLIGLSVQIGFTIVGAFVLFLGGGIWFDRRMGTSPIFLLIGLVLAFIAVGYNLYEIATIGYKPRTQSKAGAGQPTPVTAAPKRDWDDPEDDWDRDDWKRDDRERDDDWPVQKPGSKSGGS